MKHYDSFNSKKYREQSWKKEHNNGGFKCSHCKQFVVINSQMGTVNRNHCNICLWSKHVDEEKGDRKAVCHGGMEPIGLTFKHEGYSKIGEIMLVHACHGCTKLSINRIARDDPEYLVMSVFENSIQGPTSMKEGLEANGIDLAAKHDRRIIDVQLFGNVA